MDCSLVYLEETEKNGIKMNGVFSRNEFKKGELIEYGIAAIVNANGNENPHFFTWSDTIPNKTWAMCSGASPFYNTSLDANTEMKRDFVNNSFQIIAKKDIKKDEELTHQYKSLTWRTCFSELYSSLKN